jgi:hypothetical protein
MKAILSILCAVVLFGCTRSKSVNTPVNSDLIASFNYKPGTYWIYRDSISGEIDSFFVRSNSSETSYLNGKSIDNIQIAISEYHIYPATADTNSWIFIYQSDMFCIKYSVGYLIGHVIDYYPITNYPFTYDIHTCAGCFTGEDSSYIVNIFDSYQILGQTYSSVSESSQRNTIDLSSFNEPNYSYNDLFFISAEVGLIKIKMYHPLDALNRVWEIIRYKINK